MKLLYLMATATAMLVARDNDLPADPPPTDPAPKQDVNFTPEQQEKINEIVQKRVKNMRSELETSEKRYEQLLKNQNLTSQERDEIATELEQVQNSLRTKEQQAAHEAKRREAEFNRTLESTQGEAKKFRSLFETQTRNNAILSAAQVDAFNPELFIDILAPRTEIVEVENEQGEKTGQFAVKVRVTKKAEDGTASEVLVSPAEAIEDMKAQPDRFGGLFRGNVAKGVGQGSNSSFAGNSRLDVKRMSDQEYFQNRGQITKQLGIRSKPKF